jgi:chitin disaccharide deacetylase
MLIINADDWGRDQAATDTALACCQGGRVSSVSAMVFMEDSARAAEVARAARLDVGLHVNFTDTFNGPNCSKEVVTRQGRIRRFLKTSKYALLIYQPLLTSHFRHIFEAQLAEFIRLYGRRPSHFDGHQHMHLSTNMLAQRIIPAGEKVRRSFSFEPGERGWVNLLYRRIVDHCLAQRYRLTDFFFALSQHLGPNQLSPVLALARTARVELMAHTWSQNEYHYLMSNAFCQLSDGVEIRGYASL